MASIPHSLRRRGHSLDTELSLSAMTDEETVVGVMQAIFVADNRECEIDLRDFGFLEGTRGTPDANVEITDKGDVLGEYLHYLKVAHKAKKILVLGAPIQPDAGRNDGVAHDVARRHSYRCYCWQEFSGTSRTRRPCRGR